MILMLRKLFVFFLVTFFTPMCFSQDFRTDIATVYGRSVGVFTNNLPDGVSVELERCTIELSPSDCMAMYSCTYIIRSEGLAGSESVLLGLPIIDAKAKANLANNISVLPLFRSVFCDYNISIDGKDVDNSLLTMSPSFAGAVSNLERIKSDYKNFAEQNALSQISLLRDSVSREVFYVVGEERNQSQASYVLPVKIDSSGVSVLKLSWVAPFGIIALKSANNRQMFYVAFTLPKGCLWNGVSEDTKVDINYRGFEDFEIVRVESSDLAVFSEDGDVISWGCSGLDSCNSRSVGVYFISKDRIPATTLKNHKFPILLSQPPVISL